MMRLRPSTLAICFALLATGCNQSVDARFESTLERAIERAPTPQQATRYRNLREVQQSLTPEEKQEWIEGFERLERANKAVEDIEAEGRAKGYL